MLSSFLNLIVYGDHTRSMSTAASIAQIEAVYRAARAQRSGIERHGRLCGAFILAGELAQGISDADMALHGCDTPTPAQQAIMAYVMDLAGEVLMSWSSGFAAASGPVAALRADIAWPCEVTLRQPEGFAFYAVYPESYALAALSLGVPQARVIGLRSIGTSLAAIAAAALGAPAPVTVRPVGHPFARRLDLSARYRLDFETHAHVPHVIADEGPGLSGSSFGAAASALIGAGVAEGNIVCLPSHDNNPGEMGEAPVRARYGRLRKVVVPFERLFINGGGGPGRLETWFADLAGPAIAPLQDVSGGAWLSVRRMDVPVRPAQERRKFLLQTEAGCFLLKFVGLGEIGAAKFDMARRLAAHGFVPEVLGFRHGFMIERWHQEARCLEPHEAPQVERLGFYLGSRAVLFPGEQGADLQTLAAMARHNTEEALGVATARALRFNTDLAVRPVYVDARLHRWEWLALPDGRLLKADAVDHATGHDLIGCQDVAWDIAGACVEFALSAEETDRLRRIVEGVSGAGIDPALVDDCLRYYSAFQLGLWAPARPERYLRWLDGQGAWPGCRAESC